MKVLIDTSFILPILGIEVEGVEDEIKKFPSHEIYYTEISILESFWVIKRIEKKTKIDMKRVKEGLRSLRLFKLVKIPFNAYVNAYKLKEKHSDFIDLLLYFTAKYYSLKFLTLDRKIKELDTSSIVIDSLS
ncbi:PIN domain-containing protein [Sulfurisphaera javensis]|uniref:PIN domain-containing protein n=1 Tax=Sulfurisphaera javensis TaxID=2049879 RepID=A0AAT9GS09_9CREN